MARRTRAAKIEDRTNRLKLPIAKKPVFVKIGPRVSLGYRRNQTAGTWVVRAADGKGSNWTKAIGVADDFETATGTATLTFWQAQDRARIVARGGRTGSGGSDEEKPLTVAVALERYEADLKTRGAEASNVARVRRHLPEKIADRLVAVLTKHELRKWRDGLIDNMAPASANRVATALRAALNLVSDGNEGIANHAAWESGLKAIPDATETRNVVIGEPQIRRLVSEAATISPAFGLLVEVAAVTGARVSQLARLEVQDAKHDHLSMPTSRKGRGVKKMTRRQVPIPPTLAARLQAIAAGRSANDPLLTKDNGDPWRKSDQTRPFRKAAKLAGLDSEDVTMYALRHSSITRQLTAGIPIRIVAVLHDTSVAMIEKTYSVGIDKHVDEMIRPALLDLAPQIRRRGGKVISIARGS
jgi:integrase